MNYSVLREKIKFALSQVNLETKVRDYKIVYRYRGDKGEQQYTITGNANDVVDKIEDCLGKYASHPNIVELRLEIWDGKGNNLRHADILNEDYVLNAIEPQVYSGQWQRPEQRGDNGQQHQQNMGGFGMAGAGLQSGLQGAVNVLSAFGFPTPQPLDGAEPMNDLQTLLAARDMNRDREYELRRSSELCKEYKQKIEVLELEKDKLERKLARAEANIDKCKDYIEELEKLKPERTLFGTSLVGIGTGIVQGVLRNNAGLIGSLLGVDEKTALAGMSSGGSIEAPQEEQFKLDDIDDDVVVSKAGEGGPRSENIKRISDWIKELGESDYQKLINILSVFMQNGSAISALYDGWKQSQTPATTNNVTPQTNGVYHAQGWVDDEETI